MIFNLKLTGIKIFAYVLENQYHELKNMDDFESHCFFIYFTAPEKGPNFEPTANCRTFESDGYR
jgi:hypothetical protein